MIDRDEPYPVESVGADPVFRNSRFSEREGICSCVAVPLRSRNVRVGVMFVNSRTLRRFTASERNDIELFADQAALAIRNAQLDDEQRREQQALVRLSEQLLASLDAAEIVRSAAKLAVEVLRVERGHIILRDSDGGLRTWAAWPEEGVESDPPVTDEAALVIDTGAWVVSDYRTERRFDPSTPRSQGFRWGLGVPLVAAGRILGAVTAHTKRARRFSEPEVNLLQLVAHQTAAALSGAQQYEDLRRASEVPGSGQEQLEEAYRQLEELDRRKTEFLSEISHELPGPLTPVGRCLEYLATQELGPVDARYERLIDVALVCFWEEVRMMDDLLGLEQIKSGKVPFNPRRTSLATLAQEIIRVFTHDAEERGLTLRPILPDGDPLVVVADADKLRQALTNVVANAIKFTPEKGSVSLRVRRVRGEESERVEVEVADTGPGIPEEESAHVFDPYYQGSGLPQGGRKGLGLGLSIARRYVELHGGTIEVASGEPEGAVFRISLPIEVVGSAGG